MNNNGKIEPVDLSNLLNGYEGKWVVISFDEQTVLKSGQDLDELSDYINKGIVMLVPEPEYLFIGQI